MAIAAWVLEQIVLALMAHIFSGLQAIIPITFWAHVGGLICGFLLGRFFIRLGYMERYRDNATRHALLGYA